MISHAFYIHRYRLKLTDRQDQDRGPTVRLTERSGAAIRKIVAWAESVSNTGTRVKLLENNYN